MTNNSNLFLSIGKPIKDEYGRTVGKVASFALTPNGKFDGVYVESNDGKFVKQSMEHLTFNGAEVTFTSNLKSRASILCDQIPLIWRKNQALKDLAEKRKISPDLYQELRSNFEAVLNQLKKDAQDLSEEANKEVVRCNQEIKTLGYAVVNLELEHEIGQVDEEAYQSAFTLLQENLKRANIEKSDIELTKSKLSNIMLGDSNKQLEQKISPILESTKEEAPTEITEEMANEVPTETPAEVAEDTITETPDEIPDETSEEAPELPEPPVVVYVKEVGKAGI
ncbi:CdvA-like protein [Candidatus Bathyarchaeota archaeon]|nr:CdvA-like protein [Candidatus Bathyarchaeota archaeon]